MADDDPRRAQPGAETLDFDEAEHDPGLAATLASEAEVVRRRPGPDTPDFGPRYEVRSMLGEGGMGAVYEVFDRELEEVVALKTLRTELVDDRRAALRLRREVKLARRITHPGVARVYDLEVGDHAVFLTMEFVPGRSLGDILQRAGRMEPDECTRYATAMCEALRAAHAAGVIHRDLKPDNVLVTDDQRVVLTDFGIATTAANETTDEFVGTPHYVAPEQARGRPVDGRADLYALGVMMFEMLTGTPPWTGDSVTAVIMRRLVEPPPPIPADLNVPSVLRDVVARCIARAPADRFQTAEQIIEALSAEASTGNGSTPVLEMGRGPRTNLSVPASTFVGRRAEQDELHRRLIDDGQRLVTLLGPGGTGKTRLACEYGRARREQYSGGVWFCDLSAATNAEQICEEFAAVLDVPLGTDDPVERLGRALHGRNDALVILDNTEQIAEPITPLIRRWLEQATETRFLVTTRVRLGLEGEHLMPVDPLTPDDGVELFEQRARQVRPRFRVNDSNRRRITEIVDGVDRLPLAIELAAARLRMIDVDTLRKRLDDRFRLLRSSRRDRPERHSTLRAVLEGSWALLSPAARLALAQLSVFRGGATLDAACRVIDLGTEDAWPEDAIEELWDHSLIRWSRSGEGERLVLLQTVQEFAAEQLTVPGPARARHGHVFAEFGGDAADASDSEGFVRRLRAERANILAACEWAVETGDAETAVKTLIAADLLFETEGLDDVDLVHSVVEMGSIDDRGRARALHIFGRACTRRGRLDDAGAALDQALLLGEDGDPLFATDIWMSQGWLRYLRGEYERAREPLSEAIDASRRLGERSREGLAASHMGLVEWNLGALDDAIRWHTEALACHRDVGNRRRQASTLGNLGLIYADRGDLEQATLLYEEALEIHREFGDVRAEGLVLTNLATARHVQGRTDEALRLWAEALELHRRTGNERAMAIMFLNLGTTEWEAGQTEAGIDHLEQALAIFRAIGDRRFEGITLGSLARAHGDRDDVAAEFALAEEILREVGDRFGLGRLLCKKGLFLAERGELDDARDALAAATEIRDEVGAGEESMLSQIVADLRTALE